METAHLSYKVAKDENMQAAYEYAYKFRENSYRNNSICNLRFNWLEITAQIQKKIFQILIILRYKNIIEFRIKKSIQRKYLLDGYKTVFI